jgi:Uncharacterized protein conserved in bacteria
MESPARQVSLVPPPDRRQSETALAVARGTARLLRSLGFSCVSELPLPSGRRADLVALNERGEIWIVEIKSSIEDLRADQKWQDYRAHCDRLFFAFTQDLPCEIFPADTGLIVADAYGAHMHCEAPEHRLPAPTRKLMTVGSRSPPRSGSIGWSIRRATGSFRATLPRRALGQNALQGAAMHVQPPRRFRDVAVAHFVDALDVLPAHAIRRHRIVRQFGLLGAAREQGRDDIVGVGGL